MNELKIVKKEKVVVNDSNYRNISFLYANASAIIKVIYFLSRDNKILFNPLELINKELIVHGEIDDNSFLYNSSVSCLITACKYLDNELKFGNNIDTKVN